jgi:hypothetical protein
MAKTPSPTPTKSEPAPGLTAAGNPFLRVIRDEAYRLEGGFLASAGHLDDVLGAPLGSPEGESRLLAFADAEGLDVEAVAGQAIHFRRRPEPSRRETTPPPMPAA